MTFSEFSGDPWDRRLKSVQVGDLKLILADRGPAELYDLAADPGETNDIAPRSPFATELLMQTLRRALWRNATILEGFGGTEAASLDPDTVEFLRALGYLR